MSQGMIAECKSQNFWLACQKAEVDGTRWQSPNGAPTSRVQSVAIRLSRYNPASHAALANPAVLRLEDDTQQTLERSLLNCCSGDLKDLAEGAKQHTPRF